MMGLRVPGLLASVPSTNGNGSGGMMSYSPGEQQPGTNGNSQCESLSIESQWFSLSSVVLMSSHLFISVYCFMSFSVVQAAFIVLFI